MKKILVIQTAFIGDAILASSLLESIHKSDAEAEIHFLLRKGNEGLYKGHPFLNKVWVWNKSNKYSSMLSIIKGIRKEKFDEVINLQRFFSSGLITACSGARKKYGFKKNPLSFAFSQSFAHEIGEKGQKEFLHEVDRNQLIIAERFPEFSRKLKLYPSVEDFNKVQAFQNEAYITMSPASVWFTKRWPQAKWVGLINSKPNQKIYLLGALGDKEYLDEIISKSSAKTGNLAGKLSLLESAALMKSADMNYVNDSAPLHLASSQNAPVAAVFCSTIPEFGFGPLSDNSTVWETSENLGCRPCGLHGFKACPKGHFMCAEVSEK